LIVAALLAVPGASAYFKGCAVIYTRHALLGIRDVREEMLAGIRAATEPYALLKARIIRERFLADWGVGESGAAGPAGNRYGDAAGHTVFAVAGPVDRSRTLETGHGDRVANMYAFATAALDLLLEALETK
jgi:nicotinamide mononucleotide (NMN) deamidase PncC